MDQMIDRFALALGHPFPRPVRWVLSMAWWIIFILAMMSVVSPERYESLRDAVGSSEMVATLPPSHVTLWVMIWLTIAQVLHGEAIKRRSEIVA